MITNSSKHSLDGLRDTWDAVVVGAGPAGSLAALLLARRGRSVLQVDKAVLPRWKVCGACLGASGVETLRRCGLGEVLGSIKARPLRSAELVWRGRRATAPLRGMVAVSRRGLDQALAESAADAGVCQRFGVLARAEPEGEVTLEGADGRHSVRARAIVMAGGLRSGQRSAGTRVDPKAWIGLGCTSEGSGVSEDGLTMLVGRRGYLGQVVTEDGAVNWAAAVDPDFVRVCGSPGAAMRAICEEAGSSLCPPLEGWTGTPGLTRRSPARIGAVYAVGDAAGYVEPITGEGMSWALATAEAAVPFVDEAIACGCHGAGWQRAHRRLMRWRRVRCRVVSRGLRSGVAMGVAMAALQARGVGRLGVVDRLIGGPA